MKIDELIGTWRLCSYKLKTKNGDCYNLYSNNPKGHLLYDRNGIMPVMMFKTDKPKITTIGSRNFSENNKALLSDEILKYSGKFKLLNDKIFHHAEVNSIPNLSNTTFERYYELTGGKMILTTPITIIHGMEAYFILVWEKTI